MVQLRKTPANTTEQRLSVQLESKPPAVVAVKTTPFYQVSQLLDLRKTAKREEGRGSGAPRGNPRSRSAGLPTLSPLGHAAGTSSSCSFRVAQQNEKYKSRLRAPGLKKLERTSRPASVQGCIEKATSSVAADDYQQRKDTSGSVSQALPPRQVLASFMERLEADIDYRKRHLDSLRGQLYPKITKSRPEKLVINHAVALYERGLSTYTKRLSAPEKSAPLQNAPSDTGKRPTGNRYYARTRKTRTFEDLIAESKHKAELLRQKTLQEQQKKQRDLKGSYTRADSSDQTARKAIAATVLPKLQSVVRDRNRLYNVEVIREKLMRQEMLRRELEKRRELQALAECTFFPVTNQQERPVIHLPQRGPSVEGVDQYFRRALMAKRLEQDKKDREAQVFGRYHRSSVL